MFIPRKQRGRCDFPITCSRSLREPEAFAQALRVTLSLQFFRPDADFSDAVASVLLGSK